ncbi:hypothetical protein QJS66_11560 [Kocuria rhizophila]|nr:hypothetical protein QJS66_11560 [Kocuria rhizophila]
MNSPRSSWTGDPAARACCTSTATFPACWRAWTPCSRAQDDVDRQQLS